MAPEQPFAAYAYAANNAAANLANAISAGDRRRSWVLGGWRLYADYATPRRLDGTAISSMPWPSITVSPSDQWIYRNSSQIPAPDPVDLKIQCERAWMIGMADRAYNRARLRATERARDLLTELFGGQTTVRGDYIVIPSKLHAGRVYSVETIGNMVRVLPGSNDREGSPYTSCRCGTCRDIPRTNRTYRLCAAPEGGLPGPDVAIAQALFLAADEAEFLRSAVVHP